MPLSRQREKRSPAPQGAELRFNVPFRLQTDNKTKKYETWKGNAAILYKMAFNFDKNKPIYGRGEEVTRTQCYSYITNNSNLLIFAFCFAKMQPWKNSVQWNSRPRYGDAAVRSSLFSVPSGSHANQLRRSVCGGRAGARERNGLLAKAKSACSGLCDGEG